MMNINKNSSQQSI